VLDGLEKLGAALTSDEKEAYLHCWKVIGHFTRYSQRASAQQRGYARDLAAAIARRQFGSSSEGKALTRALVDMMAAVLPGDVFKHVAPLIRYFLGKEHASWLGIENYDPISLIAGPTARVGRSRRCTGAGFEDPFRAGGESWPSAD
jgi:hypothetical protein